MRFRIRNVCRTVDFNGKGNPIVQFLLGDLPKTVVNLPADKVKPIDTTFFKNENISTQELILTSDLSDPACSSIAERNDQSSFGVVVFGLYEGAYWIHDPRFVSVVVNDADWGGA